MPPGKLAARNFYCEHGYHELDITTKIYRGLKDGIHLEKWLRRMSRSGSIATP